MNSEGSGSRSVDSLTRKFTQVESRGTEASTETHVVSTQQGHLMLGPMFQNLFHSQREREKERNFVLKTSSNNVSLSFSLNQIKFKTCTH